jgi:histidine triad (HIT) family protein
MTITAKTQNISEHSVLQNYQSPVYDPIHHRKQELVKKTLNPRFEKKRYSYKGCPFCQLSILNYQKFYEDNLILALYTHKPILPGHCLIIPKRHIERFEMLSDSEATQICRAIRKVDQAVMKVFGTSSYLIWQKNGREVGQSVAHIHFHYIPRIKGDGSVWKFIFRTFWANVQKPIRRIEMRQTVEKMKAAMKQVC